MPKSSVLILRFRFVARPPHGRTPASSRKTPAVRQAQPSNRWAEVVGDAQYRTMAKERTAMASKAELNQRDHQNMNAFLGHVLDDYKAGEINNG
ncbi:Uncharacterized protein ALO59_04026 [Pseudomonas amygdali pv. mellea]|nr:Uncharacterized protein ALO59_04026 [Pseudomonas amygdali pv. mellea]